MPRFTISHHTGSKEGDHFDLMIEEEETLRTWRFQNTNFETEQAARQIKDHRKTYLDYEGEVSGGRGHVKIWDTGVYAIDVRNDKSIQVALAGKQLKIRLRLERASAEPGADARWTVIDAALQLKRKVAAHLRSAELETAPTPELEELRTALLHEEGRLLSLVGHYSKGGDIDWTLADPEKELRDRLHDEWVRWRNPWLDQARNFSRQLDEVAEAVRATRPTLKKT